MENDRQSKCRYIHRFCGVNHNESHCVVDGWENDKVKTMTEEDCGKCEKYKSMYIEYPIEVNKINSEMRDYWKDNDCGQLVKIRPCGKEYGDKTYLGILLGDLPFTNYISYHEETKELNVSVSCNPAIFVPELKKIIFGMESWWGRIKNADELKEITNDDIDNVWYVKLLKEMSEGDKQ